MSMLNKRLAAFVLLTFLGLTAHANGIALLGIPLKQNPNLAGSIPKSRGSEIILSRSQYVISYNKDRHAPNWVAWELDDSEFGNSGRSNLFMPDQELKQYLTANFPSDHAVTTEDYSGSCFDRGHQTPSADRSTTVQDNEATFLMSNMIPQTPFLNRVVWEHLESYTRDLVKNQGKKVYVIAGPIYDQNYGHIGVNADIEVPSKNFKVIVILDANQNASDITKATPMISVIMPNVQEDGTPISIKSGHCPTFNPTLHSISTDWHDYVQPIGEIEKESGLDLFSSFQ